MFRPGNCLLIGAPVHPVSLWETWLLLGMCLLSLCLTLSPPFSLQCSVSCGVGTQRRQQMCQKLTAKGRRVPLSDTLCWHLSGPPLVRSCQMPLCKSKYGKSTLCGICSFYSSPPVASFSIEQLISNL